MQKHLVLGLCLLTGALTATTAMAGTSGINKTAAQLNILNTCVGSYMDQANTFATYQGGSCVNAVNFQAKAGEQCAAVIDTSKTLINENCVITVVTPSNVGTILPALTNQTFVLTPFTDTTATPTAYSSTVKTAGIVSWTINYTPSSTQDLRDMTVLGVEHINMLAKVDAPLNSVTKQTA